MRNPYGQRQSLNERIMLRASLRCVDMRVLLENCLEAPAFGPLPVQSRGAR
jgi:hypothetical protein